MSQPLPLSTVRGNILTKAKELTIGERNKTYGDPIENFTRFGQILTGYFGMEFSAHDAAMIMMLAKVARVPATPTHEDNYVDGAAYLAIAGEMAAFGAHSAIQARGEVRSSESGNSQAGQGVPATPSDLKTGPGRNPVPSTTPTSLASIGALSKPVSGPGRS